MIVRSLAVGGALVMFGAGAVAADPAFERWSREAAAGATSPARPEAGDARVAFAAPDGREVSIVVRAPRPPPGAPTVTMEAVPTGVDAGPALARALAAARAQRAARLVIPPGTYAIAAPPRAAPGHVVVQGLDDLVIDGSGATLVFAADRSGLYVTQSRRLKIVGLTLDYGVRTSSVAETRRGPDGETLLTVVEPAAGTGSADRIAYVTELDRESGRWVPGGRRAILPDGHPDGAQPAGERSFRSPVFRAWPPGGRYAVLHQYYGGNAVQIQDAPASGDRQAEDISLDGLTIRSAPGMGVVAYGLKRGLLVTHSVVAPRPGQPVSTNFDAVHVQLSSGDTIVSDNRFERSGDDAINLNSPVHPVVGLDDPARPVLGTYSRFVRA